jgi:hypothetical protein
VFIVDKEAGNRARQQLEALATAIGLECDASLASYVGDGSSLRPFLTVDQARRAQETQPTRAIQIIMYGTGTINPAIQPAPTPQQQDIIDCAKRCYPESAIETAESEALSFPVKLRAADDAA